MDARWNYDVELNTLGDSCYIVGPCIGSDDVKPDVTTTGGGATFTGVPPFPGVTPFGAVNPEGESQGKPQFTTHPLHEFSDWVKETRERDRARLEASQARERKKAEKIEAAKARLRGVGDEERLQTQKAKAREADSQRIVGVGDMHGAPAPVRLPPARTETEARFNKGYSGETSDFLTKFQMRQTSPRGAGITLEDRERARLAELPSGRPQVTMTREHEAQATEEARNQPSPDPLVSLVEKAGEGAVKTAVIKYADTIIPGVAQGMKIVGWVKAAQEGKGEVAWEAIKFVAGKAGPTAGMTIAAGQAVGGKARNLLVEIFDLTGSTESGADAYKRIHDSWSPGAQWIADHVGMKPKE